LPCTDRTGQCPVLTVQDSAVGGDERAGEGPEGDEAVVHDVEGLGLVAEVVLAPPSVGVLLLFLPAGGRGVGGRR